jgi:hypothetical protein
MKKWGMFIIITLFLVSFAAALDIGITTGAINNVSSIDNEVQQCINNCPTGCAAPEYRICASDGEKYCNTCTIECYGLTEVDDSVCENGNTDKINAAISAKRTNLTTSQIKNIITTRNKLKFEDRTKIPCPTSCICTGSTMKCTLLGGREITIFAGNSGNVIVQVKGENMTTKVTLYKSPDGKVYGIFKNNETRIIKMLPDQVREKIKERIKTKLENENITLNENGSYEYTAQKRAKLFFIFPVRMAVRAEIDSETGEVIKISKPKWWAFLAKDESSEQIVGASCGTVTPGENDNCCKNKGYDVWNAETSECEFSS